MSQDAIHDVVGVGFGPSNLALAIALDEALRQRGAALSHHFIEKQPGFTWHGGMLLPDSDMQISFLKDLVSLRDPTSPLTFVNYLHQKGRLEAFINRKTFFPSRVEFNDYLGWVAARFAEHCSYGEEVTAVEPETAQGTVVGLRVRSRTATGGETVRRAHNLVVATGGSPRIPSVFAGLRGDPRVFHSSAYLDRIHGLGLARKPSARVAVIGGGQSAAEITLDLHGRFPQLGIDLVFRGHALKPSDDTPFVNEIFNPGFTDYVFGQGEAQRDAIIREFRNTNYAVVDADLIERIYDILYQQQVQGAPRLALCGRSEVTEAEAGADGIGMALRDGIAGTAGRRGYDAVVLATGYERDGGRRLLSALAPWIEDFAVDRDYRLRTRPEFRPQIHLQGQSETSHGLSDTLLSVLAVRSQEIAESLLAARRRRGMPPDLHAPAPLRRLAVNDD
ncbi:lysine N(6)-hydroxylase/L-ornithine N(5)-oxygenase family protein [Inquilinus limosus]|uniref:Ornithine monooxygenase n=1 Tax=Inquilinus limosus MP06 TaxID=1398085 RepID=A0A0A0D371_9PROT|nr:lysine N(6)-hydroxylase/L-ornithine N(5)-oxygenase family protein [Inquilinus limosus]KGM32328.1 ornithine monooxygenase [Inquilinus limosus MP06]